MNLRYVPGLAINLLLIIGGGLVVLGLFNSLIRGNGQAQVALGVIAAAVIVVGMGGYAWLMFAGRNISRARLAELGYPSDIEDAAVTGPLPEALNAIDGALKAAGYVLDSERRGMHAADGTPTTSWHYHSADSTVHALIAVSADGKDSGMVLDTYFEDGTQLTTRLSRTIPKIEREGYESHSVERLEEIIPAHDGHVRRIAAGHGKPIAVTRFEDEHALAAKNYARNMGYMFDAMWRRNVIWLIAVEGIGLLALLNGLLQLLLPGMSTGRGLAILVGGAVLMGALTGGGIVALRRVQGRKA